MSVDDIQKKLQEVSLEEKKGKFTSNKMTAPVSREEFALLQEQLKQLLANQSKSNKSASTVVIEKDPPPSHGKGLKPTKLPEYHGDRLTYPSWRTAVLDIFRMDWNVFGYDDSRAFVMIYGALKGTALKRAGPFYEAGGVHGTRKPEDFLEFLDRLNLDPLRTARANTELHAMKMKDNQRWPDFLAAWCNKLTEAQGDFWDDRNKISMLQAALSDQLIRTMAGNHLIPNDNFDEFVRIVNQVAQQLEMVEARTKSYQNRLSQQSTMGRPVNSNRSNHEVESQSKLVAHRETLEQVGQIDSSGDTIMGGINSAGLSSGTQRRAKWKNHEQLDRLRREGKCFRCERVGCASNRCTLLPARRPNNKGPRVNNVVLPEIDPSVYEEEIVSSESGRKSSEN